MDEKPGGAGRDEVENKTPRVAVEDRNNTDTGCMTEGPSEHEKDRRQGAEAGKVRVRCAGK